MCWGGSPGGTRCKPTPSTPLQAGSNAAGWQQGGIRSRQGRVCWLAGMFSQPWSQAFPQHRIACQAGKAAATADESKRPGRCWRCCVLFTLQVDSVVHEDPECARLRSVTEQYRETHWKLTAPKGFATLKVRGACAAATAAAAVSSDEGVIAPYSLCASAWQQVTTHPSLRRQLPRLAAPGVTLPLCTRHSLASFG